MRGCRWDAVGGGRPPLRLRRPCAPPGLVLVQGARGCDGTGLLPWAADQTVGLNRVRSVRRASLCGCSGLQAPWTGAEAGGGRLQARTTAFQSHLSHCVSGRAPTLPDPRVLKNGSRVRATSRHRERIGSAALRPAGIWGKGVGTLWTDWCLRSFSKRDRIPRSTPCQAEAVTSAQAT